MADLDRMVAGWHRMAARGTERPSRGSSEESPSPKIQRLPRKPGGVRDYAHLTPDQFARHTGKASEKEAMSESPTEAHFPDGRPEKMGLSSTYGGFQGRDIKTAARRKKV